MIDELREEAIVNKVGGRFKLSTLIQKRLVAINAGARPLVDDKVANKMEIVIQEILQDKIYLDAQMNVQVTGAVTGGVPEVDFRTAVSELYTMKGREVLIAVTGGIAAYKTAALVSQLVQAGAGVSVIMTRSATKLVAPKTFEALSGRPVVTAVLAAGRIRISRRPARPRCLCVAPATANIVAKAALGLADEIVSTVLLAFDGPIIVAPAMNVQMWSKPPVRAEHRPASGRRHGDHRSRDRAPELRRSRGREDGRTGGDLRGHCGTTGSDRPQENGE